MERSFLPHINGSARNILKEILFWVLPLWIVIAGFFFYRKPSLVVSQLSLDQVNIFTFDDRVKQGNSSAWHKYEQGGAFRLEYILKEGLEYPYAGLGLEASGNSVFDLSQFDHVRVKIKATKGRRIHLVLSTEVPNYTIPGNPDTYRPAEYLLEVGKDTKEFIINLNEFKTPNWWFQDTRKQQEEFGPLDFARVKFINLGNCQLIEKGTKDVVIAEEIIFYKGLTSFYIFSGIFLLLYYSIGTIVLIKNRRNRKTELTFQYERTETFNQLEEEEKKIFGFLTTHYSKPDLTIIEVQNSTGIYEQKISGMIKNKTGQNFKQFLNKLRIAEAKRLLSATDLQISQIAFQVGYSNISHFNRVFKELESCSPNDFRKKYPQTSQ